jgi:hypothetical protein
MISRGESIHLHPPFISRTMIDGFREMEMRGHAATPRAGRGRTHRLPPTAGAPTHEDKDPGR